MQLLHRGAGCQYCNSHSSAWQALPSLSQPCQWRRSRRGTQPAAAATTAPAYSTATSSTITKEARAALFNPAFDQVWVTGYSAVHRACKGHSF